MLSLLLKRLGGALIVMWVVVTLAFAALNFAGDPISLLVPETATPSQIQDIRESLGLDRSPLERYGKFIVGVLRGDLGLSFFSHQPAMELVLQRFPATMQLVLAALSLSIVIGVPLGVLAAVRHNSSFDRFALGLSTFGISAPTFWVAILLIFVFAVQWRLLPSSGSGTWQHLVLPAITLALSRVALFTRMIRSSMLEVLSLDYVRTARAKGVPGWRVIYQHALRNALVPFVTVVALQMGALFAGAVVTETIFAWPGMNRLALDAMQRLDYPVILAFALVVAALFTFLNLIADLMYGLVDPRVRFS